MKSHNGLRIAQILLMYTAFVLHSHGTTLKEAAKTADAIVVGTVLTRTESKDDVLFSINVDEVIKGNSGLTTIDVDHPWQRLAIGPPSRTINASLHGIWFLQRTATSTWNVLTINGADGVMPSLFWPISDTLPAVYAATTPASQSESLTLRIAAAVEQQKENAAIFLNVIDSTRTPASTAVLAHFVASADPALEAVGIAGQLEQGDGTSLKNLMSLWPTISTAPEHTYVTGALRNAFRDQSPNSIESLVQMANTTGIPDEIRKASTRALAAMHPKEALPALALLLSNSDPEEQMKGVFGLAAFANGCPPQTQENAKTMEYLQFHASPYRTKETMDNFAFRRGPADQESKLVAFWLSWWNQNKASLSAN